MELDHQQRIAACEKLAADLEERGWTTKVWTSTKGPNPGCGVQVQREPEGDVWASVTVTKSGFISFQKVSEELTQKQISKLGDDLTYPGDEKPVRPSPEFTKVLSREMMNGGGRPSGLMQKLGFVDKPVAPHREPKKTHPPREPGEDDDGPGF